MKRQKIKKIIYKSIPLWMVIVIILQSSTLVGLVEYYIMQRNINIALAQLAQTTKNPEELVKILTQKVMPQKGYTLAVVWNDIGQQLMRTGVIDKQKYDQMFSQDPGDANMMKYLSTSSHDHMIINEANSHFMVNTLWGLGLVNKNQILEEGPMQTEGPKDPMQFASTGGWTLGTKSTSDLYSSTPLIELTDKQEDLVKEISSNIYRPCCGNSVAFPDCNHGMAALGYIELAVKQGISEKRIYQDVLALNSFWFPQQYVSVATFFSQQKKDWDSLDPKMLLSAQYSSAQGAAQIQQQIQNIPGIATQQGGCGA